MKKRTKVLSLLLATTMVSGLLAGCGAEKEQEKNEVPAVSQESAVTASTETKVEEEAEPTDPVHLRLVMYGVAGDRNMEFFENDFNEKIKEDLNMTIEVDYLAWGEKAKLEAMLSAGEEFALMIYGNQMDLAEKGYLTEISEEMIKETAPNLMNARMGLDFASCKFKGVNYVVPVGAQAVAGLQDDIVIRNDILNEVGLDYTEIKTLEDLTEACIAVKEKFPDMEIGTFSRFPCNVEEGQPVVSKGGDPTYTITDVSDPDSDQVWGLYGSEYLKSFREYFYHWKELGFFENEGWLTDTSYAKTAWDTGRALLSYGGGTNIIEHDLQGVEGAEVQLLELENDPNVMVYNYDWGWSVSAEGAEYADDLLRLIDWIYATEDNYNFSLYGVQGVDWEYGEDGKTINKLTGDTFFYDWQFRSMYYQDTEAYDAEEWQRYLDRNNNAINHKLIGFVFDPSPVEVELAAVKAVISEYDNLHLYDSYDEWAEVVLPKLEEAGYQKYVEEAQRQVSEWMANSK